MISEGGEGRGTTGVVLLTSICTVLVKIVVFFFLWHHLYMFMYNVHAQSLSLPGLQAEMFFLVLWCVIWPSQLSCLGTLVPRLFAGGGKNAWYTYTVCACAQSGTHCTCMCMHYNAHICAYMYMYVQYAIESFSVTREARGKGRNSGAGKQKAARYLTLTCIPGGITWTSVVKKSSWRISW